MGGILGLCPKMDEQKRIVGVRAAKPAHTTKSESPQTSSLPSKQPLREKAGVRGELLEYNIRLDN